MKIFNQLATPAGVENWFNHIGFVVTAKCGQLSNFEMCTLLIGSPGIVSATSR